MAKIAFLGIGAMGERVVKNLIEAGHEVTVYNRSQDKVAPIAEAGAVPASTPRQAADNADFVIAMVRDNEASAAVWLGKQGALDSLATNALAIEMSTLSPSWVRTLATTITDTGAGFLEAPVLGTRPQAENAQLIYLIAGDAPMLAKARPILESVSCAIHHVGEYGRAAAMKLAVNIQYGTQVAIWAESLVFLERQGIVREEAVALMNTLPTTAPAMQVAGMLMASKQYLPLFPIELVEKDFAYAEEVAQNIGLDAHTLQAVRKVYTHAKDKGYGDSNIIGVAQIYE